MSFTDQTSKLVELGFIYALKDPRTDEIFYIGATESAPKDRLMGHYSHFKEYLKGLRKETKKFKKFEEFFPDSAKLELIEIVQNDYLYKKEIEYIEKYSKTYNLTNQTYGGEGGDTFTLQDSINKSNISELIAIKNSGRKKPDGFAENLSKTRMGKNNPAAGKTTMPTCIVFDLNNNPLKMLKFPYEITEFFDKKFGIENHKLHAGRTGNITKALKKSGKISSTGFNFVIFENCTKEIQDIVQQDYENNLNKEE